jgi:hypothetical protein
MQMVVSADEHREGNVLKHQASCEGITISPRNPVECGLFRPLSSDELREKGKVSGQN